MTEIKTALNYPETGEVILIDKDLHWTSFNAVKKIKIILCKKYHIKKLKVGHAGTLDPLATGLLIICTGKETKNISIYQETDKEYLATIKLGETTPSFDLETTVDLSYPFEHITEKMVNLMLKSFIGEQDQIPPVFSAISIDGKRAYEYARKGKDVELKPRKIIYHNIELLSFSPPFLQIKIVCSKGTYIRSFARDIGMALSCGAHLTSLRRTRIGNYKIENAITVRDFELYTNMN